MTKEDNFFERYGLEDTKQLREATRSPMKPMYREILVRMDDYKKRDSGFVVKENLNTHKTGEVLALGSGHHRVSGVHIPFDVKVGDKIMFPNHCCDKYEINGEELLMFDEKEVLGVCE